MNKLIPLLLLSMLGSAFAATPWEQYLDSPTPQNAKRVEAVRYTQSDRQLSESDLRILENQVLARDGEALSLAMRLYHRSEGGQAEDLGVVVGRAARSQPELFLRGVYKSGLPCSAFSWPLNSPGLEYVDRPKAQAYELAQRQEALRSVRVRSLRRVRDECVAVFKAAN